MSTGIIITIIICGTIVVLYCLSAISNIIRNRQTLNKADQVERIIKSIEKWRDNNDKERFS